jgi:hypothetical protein
MDQIGRDETFKKTVTAVAVPLSLAFVSKR